MEITKTTIRGREINVLFTGEKYVLYSGYYGILAVAERDYNGYVSERQKFTLITGNHHTDGGLIGGCVVSQFAKRFINRNENRYIEVECEYTEETRDLANASINIGIIYR